MDLCRRCWSAKLCCRGSDGAQQREGGSCCIVDDGVSDDCGEFGDVNKWDEVGGSAPAATRNLVELPIFC